MPWQNQPTQRFKNSSHTRDLYKCLWSWVCLSVCFAVSIKRLPFSVTPISSFSDHMKTKLEKKYFRLQRNHLLCWEANKPQVSESKHKNLSL